MRQGINSLSDCNQPLRLFNQKSAIDLLHKPLTIVNSIQMTKKKGQIN